MPKLPRVSGRRLIKLLEHLGYRVIRQRGSHIRLQKILPSGTHHLTVPGHRELATGTLNDILARVSERNNIPKDTLIKML